MRASIFCTPAVLIFVVVVLAGCGGETDGLPREAVSGTVTLNGQPLDVGSISFQPSGGPAMTAASRIESGRYSISRDQGLVPGKYKVLVSSGSGPDENERKGLEPGPPSRRPVERIPPQYNVASTLTAEVTKGGENVFDFNLK